MKLSTGAYCYQSLAEYNEHRYHSLCIYYGLRGHNCSNCLLQLSNQSLYSVEAISIPASLENT
jgi:hypothetical protein